MAWQDISTSVYKHNFNTYADIDAGNGSIYVTLQYSDNPDYLSPTKARIRFKLNSSGGNFWDKIYILVGGSDGILLKIKDEYKTNSWPYYSDGFNIEKKYTESTYAIPAFYIIDNGNNATSINSASDAYWAATHAGWEGGRSQFSEAVGAKSIAIASSTTVGTDGTCAKPTITDKNNNSFTISVSPKAGTNNAHKSTTIYYSVNDGAYKTYSSAVSVSADSTIKSYAVVKFAHNTVTTDTASKTVYYYTNGSKPAAPTIADNGNNTFTISGKVSKAGSHNAIKTATLYYTIGSGSKQSKTLTTTSEGSYTFTFDVPSSSSSTSIKAYVVCTFAWDGSSSQTSDTTTKSVLYHTHIGTPSVSIVDNHNNTFTITGANAVNGTNNTATTTYAWGYTTAYGNSGTGTKSLTIAKPSDATRTVYAKATATPSWSSDSVKTFTNYLAIKQYVAPSNPGIPVISFTKSRLTIKENWTFTWTAAVAANSNSAIKGYVIRLYKNDKAITGMTSASDNITLNKGTGTQEYLVRESTSCKVVINPVEFGFAPGDTVRLGIFAYTKDGTGTRLFSGGGSSQVVSAESLVQNAGIVHVKVSNAWKEGQVYVKVNGQWKEAESVSTKVSGTWKESQ